MSKIVEKVSIVFGFLTLFFPAFVLLNLNRGLDLTDTGFYYLAIQNHPDVMSGPTLFGSIWSILPLPEKFHMHRLAVLGFLWLSAGFLANTLFSLYGDFKQRLCRYSMIALSIGAISTFYTWWLPDPSYNSITLILIPAVLALAFKITRSLKIMRQTPQWSSFWLGLLLPALGLTRPQSAVLLGPCLLVFVLIFARPDWRQICRTSFYVMLGTGTLILILAVFVEPITVSWGRLYTGYVDRGILEIDRSPGKAFFQFMENAKRIVVNKWPLTLGLIGGFLLRNGAENAYVKKRKDLKYAGEFLVASVLVFASILFVSETSGSQKLSLTNIAHFVFPLVLGMMILLLIGIACGVFTKRTDKLETDVALLLIIVALVAQVILSGNQWLKFSGWFAFYFLMTIIFYTKFRSPSETNWTFLSVIIVILAVQFAAFKQATQNPYGLRDNLFAQSILTPISSDRNILKLDQETHDFLTAFEEGRDRIAELNEPPVVIDASGRFPMLIHYLGGRPTRWPWLMSTHPGSKNMIEQSLSSLSHNQRSKAWIIVAPDWRRSHDLGILEKWGIDVTQGYISISKSYSPTIKSEVWLLAPKL